MPPPTATHTQLMRRTTRLVRSSALPLLLLGSLLGCEQPTHTTPISEPPLPFAAVPPELSFVGTLAGTAVRLVVDDCKVYRNTQDPKREQDWQKVLETEFYPIAYCHRQNMHIEKGLVTVQIGDMAFGAGGCCATGGTYTSTDGLVWKRH
jgi:hypothetical protein